MARQREWFSLFVCLCVCLWVKALWCSLFCCNLKTEKALQDMNFGHNYASLPLLSAGVLSNRAASCVCQSRLGVES